MLVSIRCHRLVPVQGVVEANPVVEKVLLIDVHGKPSDAVASEIIAALGDITSQGERGVVVMW